MYTLRQENNRLRLYLNHWNFSRCREEIKTQTEVRRKRQSFIIKPEGYWRLRLTSLSRQETQLQYAIPKE